MYKLIEPINLWVLTICQAQVNKIWLFYYGIIIKFYLHQWYVTGTMNCHIDSRVEIQNVGIQRVITVIYTNFKILLESAECYWGTKTLKINLRISHQHTWLMKVTDFRQTIWLTICMNVWWWIECAEMYTGIVYLFLLCFFLKMLRSGRLYLAHLLPYWVTATFSHNFLSKSIFTCILIK